MTDKKRSERDMSNVKTFTNDNFRVLAYLYDIKGNDNRARITQQEIADEMSLSRATVNRIIKQLKDEDYIVQDSVHIGRYLLTDKAISAIELFRATDKK